MTNSRLLYAAVVATCTFLISYPTVCSAQAPTSTSHGLLELLDANGDGTLDPFEAMDKLLQFEQEDDQKLTSQTLSELLVEIEKDKQSEAKEYLDEMDENGDGKVEMSELDPEMQPLMEMIDKNRDGKISQSEIANADFGEEMFMSPEEIEEEVEHLFRELDANQDGVLEKSEANEQMSWSQISEGDVNQDSQVTPTEMAAFFAADNQRAEFEILGEKAVMSGVINADTPAKVLRLIFEYPNVRTIEMKNVPGSIDDESNLRAARLIRKFGFTTIIRANGSVASGGTDFFLAGKQRIVETGGKLGIHSWGGPGFQGKDVPKNDPQHQLYLKYYEEIEIPSEFYWRTLEAAPANDIHWMTEKEIAQFKVRTTPTNDEAEKTGAHRSTPSTQPTPASNDGKASTKTSNPTKQDDDKDDADSKPDVELVSEAKMMLNLLDLNDNRQLEWSELEGDAKEMLGELDENNDRIISLKELSKASGPRRKVHEKLCKINTHQNPMRIVDLPKGIHRGINRHFKKYTNVLAPNGNPIHILAMDGWSDNRILRARKVLEHFLRDAKHREWGAKTSLANTMADNHATLVLLNHNRDMDRVMPAIENVDLQLQDLRANESPFEGEPDYMQHQTRDAAFEEVFHLIHGSGIIQAMKPFDREIRRLAKQAAQTKLWNYDEPNMPGNHFEYIICVYDNYLDLWKTKPTLMEGTKVGRQKKGISFFGEYLADDRRSTDVADPKGFAMIEKFNPDHISYTAELPARFKDSFSLEESGLRYSAKATHLRNVTLRGNQPSNLTGNSRDNRLVGNSADNTLTGNGGDDSLFGGSGEDTAQFRGPKSQYTIVKNGSLIEVHDSMVNRDGYDVLQGIEVLAFKDTTIEAAKIGDTSENR